MRIPWGLILLVSVIVIIVLVIVSVLKRRMLKRKTAYDFMSKSKITYRLLGLSKLHDGWIFVLEVYNNDKVERSLKDAYGLLWGVSDFKKGEISPFYNPTITDNTIILPPKSAKRIIITIESNNVRWPRQVSIVCTSYKNKFIDHGRIIINTTHLDNEYMETLFARLRQQVSLIQNSVNYNNESNQSQY